MSFVVDASIAGAWFLPDEHSAPAETLLKRLRETVAPVPSLFWHEVRSLALTAERRARLAPGEAALALGRLRQLPLEDAGPGEDAVVLALAKTHRLSAYDAAYLALARERALPLATLDRRLAQAAQRESVELVGPDPRK
jgi:predicted nucleic acid-binding protein